MSIRKNYHSKKCIKLELFCISHILYFFFLCSSHAVWICWFMILFGHAEENYDHNLLCDPGDCYCFHSWWYTSLKHTFHTHLSQPHPYPHKHVLTLTPHTLCTQLNKYVVHSFCEGNLCSLFSAQYALIVV